MEAKSAKEKTESSVEEVGATPSFRKASPEDAIDLARARFLDGQRIEMRTLAQELGIGRTTLYRWVGERDELIEEVFARLIDEWFQIVSSQARGTGRTRLIDIFTRFLDIASASTPLSDFASREPALTMRLLLDRKGKVATHSKELISTLVEEHLPDLEVPENFVDAIEMSTVALVWANIAAEREPDIEGAISLTETLIDVCPKKVA
jgi:AcrR family transcriptional regulator